MSLDIAELQGESVRLDKNNSSGFFENFVKMPDSEGVVTVRILPPAPAGAFGRQKNPFFVASRIHKINDKNIHSPKVLNKATGKWEGSCPITDYYNYLWARSKKESDAEAAKTVALARAIKPIERYYYNVIVRSETDPKTNEVHKNVGPKILSVGITLHKLIIRAILGDEALDEAPLGDITDPKIGRDFKIVKRIKKGGTDSFPNYGDSKFLDQTPLGTPEQVQQWIENLHDLEAIRIIKPIEEIKLELKRHLGLAPNVNPSGFDPSEFETGQTATASPVHVEVENTTADVVDEAGLVEDDFLQELKNMN